MLDVKISPMSRRIDGEKMSEQGSEGRRLTIIYDRFLICLIKRAMRADGDSWILGTIQPNRATGLPPLTERQT